MPRPCAIGRPSGRTGAALGTEPRWGGTVPSRPGVRGRSHAGGPRRAWEDQGHPCERTPR
ncbi:hypothetical protein Y09_1628 [Brachybacterium sp. SW0106-09]|nr:hypothetical protein Y09_1628 [Brachybacterium sp. SW0106-09]